jgi:hypothetical protein
MLPSSWADAVRRSTRRAGECAPNRRRLRRRRTEIAVSNNPGLRFSQGQEAHPRACRGRAGCPRRPLVGGSAPAAAGRSRIGPRFGTRCLRRRVVCVDGPHSSSRSQHSPFGRGASGGGLARTRTGSRPPRDGDSLVVRSVGQRAGNWWPYVVRQGDTLTLLAYRAGAPADNIWSHPKNSSLKELRKNGDVLFPTDVIYLPPMAPQKWHPLKIGQTNTFVATVPEMVLQFTLMGDDGPLAGAKYVARGRLPPIAGSADDKGNVKLTLTILDSTPISNDLLDHVRSFRPRIGLRGGRVLCGAHWHATSPMGAICRRPTSPAAHNRGRA